MPSFCLQYTWNLEVISLLSPQDTKPQGQAFLVLIPCPPTGIHSPTFVNALWMSLCHLQPILLPGARFTFPENNLIMLHVRSKNPQILSSDKFFPLNWMSFTWSDNRTGVWNLSVSWGIEREGHVALSLQKKAIEWQVQGDRVKGWRPQSSTCRGSSEDLGDFQSAHFPSPHHRPFLLHPEDASCTLSWSPYFSTNYIDLFPFTPLGFLTPRLWSGNLLFRSHVQLFLLFKTHWDVTRSSSDHWRFASIILTHIYPFSLCGIKN